MANLNTVYQLICGLQHQLRDHGHADIKVFDNPAFHDFRSTLDGEMTTGMFLIDFGLACSIILHCH